MKRQADSRAKLKKVRAQEREKARKLEDDKADELEAKRRAVDRKAEEAANRPAVVNGAGGASAANSTQTGSCS